MVAGERTHAARVQPHRVVAGFAIAGSHRIANLPVWVAVLGLPAIALGAAVALLGRRRFFEIQRAMRLGEPLRAPTAASLLPFGIALLAVAGFVILAVELARS